MHAAALLLAGATSLLHEAKVDVVTVPNLSEHLSSAETTAQLSARFSYTAPTTSLKNCKASILRVFPGEYLDQPLDRVLSDAANGIKAAQTAKKLMFEKRFTK